ncbi:MAG TPA: hypothetical protein VHJ83_07380, partial [Micromonosporaceae bacterium]|nr:hypothetical protein [Micromonosporaceae bacterium]
ALRLWLLSRGELQTMLLLIQYVSPLGLVTMLIVALIWILPAVVLTVRVLSSLLVVSDPSSGSRLVRLGDRLPRWVLVLAVILAALTWQLRFLPFLEMLVVMIVGLGARRRYPRGSMRRQFFCLAVPLAAALLCYIWLSPGIVKEFFVEETVNSMLLLAPPGMAVLLTGPVPHWAARAVIRGTAIGAAIIGPLLFIVMFSRAPILPTVAMELNDFESCRIYDRSTPDDSNCVLFGQIITVDDRMTALLRPDGTVVFVPNDIRESQVLCATGGSAPTSRVHIRGLHIESRALVLIIPPAPRIDPDPRCQGRPLPVPVRSGPSPSRQPDQPGPGSEN